MQKKKRKKLATKRKKHTHSAKWLNKNRGNYNRITTHCLRQRGDNNDDTEMFTDNR